MSDVKKQLQEVLESKRRFSEEHIENVFSKIDQQHQKKKDRWKQWGAAFVVMAAILALVLLKPPAINNDPLQSSESPLEKSLIEHFEHYTTNNAYNKIVYKEIGYEKDNIALIISTGAVDINYFVSLHEYKNNEWHVVFGDSLTEGMFKVDSKANVYAAYFDEPIRTILVGEKTIEPIRLNDQTQILVTMQDKATYPVVVDYSISPSERLFMTNNEMEELYTIDLVEMMEGQHFLFNYERDSMEMFGGEYTKLPLVIDPNETSYNLFDVVYIDTGKDQYISRILALPESTFAIENGTIIRDGIPQHTPFGSAKIDSYYSLYAYKSAFDLSDTAFKEAQEIFNKKMDEYTLPNYQYMVAADNWRKGEINTVTVDQIKGKVLGYDEATLKQTWSANEKQLFNQLKETKNRALLKGVDAKTVARLYFYAQYLADAEMTYFFYTTNPNQIEWSLEEHLIKESHEPSDHLKMFNAEYAKLVEAGKFVDNDSYGYVHLTDGENEVKFNLVKNKVGYWEISFNKFTN